MQDPKPLRFSKHTAFFAKSINWSRRIIDGIGYRMEIENLKALRSASVPKTEDDPFELVHAATWVSEAISMIYESINLLLEIFEVVYEKAGSRKKNIKRFSSQKLDGT